MSKICKCQHKKDSCGAAVRIIDIDNKGKLSQYRGKQKLFFPFGILMRGYILNYVFKFIFTPNDCTLPLSVINYLKVICK